MEIKYGTTRMVFLFRHVVIKIPLIRFFYILRRIFVHTKSGEISKKIRNFNESSNGVLGYLTRGFKANRKEYRFSKSEVVNRDILLIPVSYLFLGFIIVQPRGGFINPNDKVWKKFIKRLIKKGVKVHDLLISKNYSFYNNKICLHDYGDILTTDFLLSC